MDESAPKYEMPRISEEQVIWALQQDPGLENEETRNTYTAWVTEKYDELDRKFGSDTERLAEERAEFNVKIAVVKYKAGLREVAIEDLTNESGSPKLYQKASALLHKMRLGEEVYW